jgi:serine/threonine protein kinase
MPGPSGQSFGKYLLLDRIAAGGMAEIFRAKYVAAAGVTKSVVIKRILPHYAGNPAFVSMFTNEAKIAMSLAHGNIAQVFDFGEIDGEYFLAMEFVNGQSLSQLSRRARDMGYWVPLPIAAFIVAEICSGLHYAHTLRDETGKHLGIVHRDVSPQNVIVSYEGQVKLVDFGIAKIRSAGQQETEHGAMKGKYVYFSPEQARAKPLDGRSDIFATGILLYELITGKRPFEGKMIEVLSRITKSEFIPPSVLNAEVPRQLEEIVLKAMALKPDERYQAAVEMQDALRHYLHEADPTFSAASVGNLARFVCREDLEREGLRLEIAPDFLQKMETWRAPSRSGVDPVGTNAGTSSQRRLPAVDDRLVTEAEIPSEGRRGHRLLMAAAVLGLGVVAGLAVAFGLLRHAYTLEVSSVPAGAAVTLDGRQMGLATPARIESLSGDRAHELELSMLGRRSFHQTLPQTKERRVAVEAALEQMEASEPHVDVSTVPDAKDPVDLPAAVVPVAAWPEQKELVLSARVHALSVPSTGAARLRLDPSHSYRLTLESAAGAPEMAYFAERPKGAAVEASFGVVDTDGATISGARALYLFVPRRSGSAPSSVGKVHVVDLRSRKAATLEVDATRNGIIADRLPRFIGLDAQAGYAISVSGRADLGASGATTRVLFLLDADGPGALGVLEPGTAHRIRGAKGLWLLLPDDGADDNQGDLAVSLSASGAR